MGYSERNYTRINYKIGVGRFTLAGVCKNCFCKAYEYGKTTVENICASIKLGEYNLTEANLSDKTGAYTYENAFKAALNRMANEKGRYLNWEQLAALQIPNTTQSLSAYAWFDSYFKLMGDFQPNCDEIHLEPTTIEDIYDEVILLLIEFDDV